MFQHGQFTLMFEHTMTQLGNICRCDRIRCRIHSDRLRQSDPAYENYN
jgi:hypothetical protein